jgi:hypothetical protein
MGWIRGETYFDTYAPSFPKNAILGAHGYKALEVYDPVWRHVTLGILGLPNLVGAANHWSLVMALCPYLFCVSLSKTPFGASTYEDYLQCGAALFQKAPMSVLFKLPALANANVQNWMKNTFPSELPALQAAAGNPVDLQMDSRSLHTAIIGGSTQPPI